MVVRIFMTFYIIEVCSINGKCITIILAASHIGEMYFMFQTQRFKRIDYKIIICGFHKQSTAIRGKDRVIRIADIPKLGELRTVRIVHIDRSAGTSNGIFTICDITPEFAHV